MTLKEDLKKSMVQAAKAKDQILLDTIRSIQSEIRYKEIDKHGELTDTEIYAVIGKLCKQRRESIEQFQKAGREDLVAKESKELSVLEGYLPQQMSPEEVAVVVKKIGDARGGNLKASDMGRVMKEVMKELSGKADGRVISDAVKSFLQ